MNEMFIRRGDIFYIDIPKDEFDPHKQAGCRPCVIMSNDANNRYSSRVQYIPLTSRDKKFIPTHIVLATTSCLDKESIALCECLDGISKSFIKGKIGRISDRDMMNIENGMYIQVSPNIINYMQMSNVQKYAYA